MRPYPILAALALLLATGATARAQQGLTITPVLKSNTTMTGQPLEYSRTETPEITVALVELAPGGEVGRHMHPISGVAYLMDGALQVEMADGTRHDVKPGEAFVEANNTWHNARNTGTTPVRILVVWSGEMGKPNIVRPEVVGAAGGTPPAASSGATGGALPAGTSGAAPGGAPAGTSGAAPSASPQ